MNLKPRTWEQLDATMEGLKGELDSIKASPSDPSKHETFIKVAADIEAAVVYLKKVELDAKKALELAMDFSASGPGKKIDVRALKHLPLIYTTEKDAEFKTAFGKNLAHFNLLMYAADDLRGVDEEAVRRIERFRYLNAQLVTMDAIMLGSGKNRSQNYLDSGRMKSLPLWNEWVELSREFSAAMDTAESGAGSQWVPTGVNLVLIPDVRPEHMSRNMIQTYSMSRSPQLFPVHGAAIRGFLLSEQVAVHRSATAIGQRDSATANITFTAKKIGALTDYSSELLEDSIVNLATVVRLDHAYANGESLESALWNGQITGMGGTPSASSTFDTGVTFELATNANDDRGAWDGWRALYSAGACTTAGDAGAGLIADMFTDQLGAMGRFGYNPAEQFIGTSFLGIAKLLVLKDSANQNVTLSSEKAGGRGTFQTGVIYQAFGRNVIASTQYPQTMNAVGVVDGASTKTGYHIVSSGRFGLGEVRLLNIQASDQVAFDTDQIVVRSTWRGQMQAYAVPNSTTQVTIGAVLNV